MDDGGTNLNVPGVPETSINVAVLPSPSPDRRQQPKKQIRVYRWLPERRLGGKAAETPSSVGLG
jgi:hypothetical protein